MAFMPKCDDDFTPEYLNSVLTGFKKILKVEVRKPSTHGQVSNTRRMFLKYDISTAGEAPSTMIAKFTIAMEETLFGMQNLDMGRDMYFNQREVLLYQKMSKCSFIPRMYYSVVQENQDFVILMEDCASKSACAAEGDDNKIMQYVKYENARKAIQKLAQFHAPFYSVNPFDPENPIERNIKMGNGSNYLKEKGFDWVPERFALMYSYSTFTQPGNTRNPYAGYGEENLQTMKNFIAQSWDAVVPLILGVDFEDLGYGDLEILEKLRALDNNKAAFLEKYSDSLRYSHKDTPFTLLHGDFRSDNMVFLDAPEDDGNDIKVFDWQAVSAGNGLLDVMMFIYTGMAPRDIIKHEKTLVKEYLTTLRKEGVDIISDEECNKMHQAALVEYLSFGIKMSLLVFAMPKDLRVVGTPQSLIFEKAMNMLVALIHNVNI